MKINNILGIALSAAILLPAASCSDFLQKDNPNQLSQGTYWKTETDALMALTACYDALQTINMYNDNVDGGGFGVIRRECSTDNGWHTWGTWCAGAEIAMGTYSTSYGHTNNYWKGNYEVIKRCNTLIENINLIPDMSDDAKNAYVAEAVTLRALMYCNLVSTFRDVPYLTKPLTLQAAQAPKTPKAEIAESVIADLKTYVPMLPAKGTEATGRMTREAGYAILGRMALYNERWDDAIEAYRQVIGKVQLFKSGDGTDYRANFADLFRTENETCDEILFSVHYVGPGQGEGSTFGIAWKAPLNAAEASLDLADEYYYTDGLPIGQTSMYDKQREDYDTSNPDLKRWENKDPRFYATIMAPGMEWNGTVYDYSADNKKLKAKSTCHIRKFFTPWDTANEYDGTMDYYVIRYAEVLVSLAEAMNEKGGYGASDITGYINELRNRVGMPTVEEGEEAKMGLTLDQETLRKIIRHERRVELAFEDLRFADLYRWKDKDGRTEWEVSQQRLSDWETGKVSLYERNYRGPQDTVWPIPQTEIDTGGGILVQHDEWK